MSRRNNQPPNWEAYEHGRASSPTSIGSGSSPTPVNRISPSATSNIRPIRSPSEQNTLGQTLRHRTSSMTMRINSIRQAGGPNSIDNFARSIQRAAGFRELAQTRRGSVAVTDEDEEAEGGDAEQGGILSKSLLRQQLESAGMVGRYEHAIADEAGRAPADERTGLLRDPRKPSVLNNDLLSTPLLGSSPGLSYGTSFGTISSHPTNAARRRASILIQQRQEAEARMGEPDKEREPLLVRMVQLEDGTRTTVVVGLSTVPQTVFNSVNTLIGVGLLGLPLAVKLSGWVIGMIFLFLAAVTTNYTAKLLAYCLDVDASFVNYADVAFISFGPRARLVTQFLFSVELVAANVALVVLFADSLNALIPGFQNFEWKILCGLILIPLNFVPLRYLAYTSILGILCCVGLVLIVFIDGFIKPHSPGSLREPAQTFAFPARWSTLPMSFGLLMSPWGGHSVFPNIYRDMRHPQKYGRALGYTYVSTSSILGIMAVGGYLMFGEQVRNEITSNLLLTKGYPRSLSILVVVFIAIIPLTKVPLSCAPIISALDVHFNLDPRALPHDSPYLNTSAFRRRISTFLIRSLIIVLITAIAIVFPDFDSILAFMGSALCFTICVILPIAFYLKTFGAQIGRWERILDYFVIVVCSILAIIGTIYSILPKDNLHA